MTGISDIVRHVKRIRRSFVYQLLKLLPTPWFTIVTKYVPLNCGELDSMPKPKLGYFQENVDACNPFGRVNANIGNQQERVTTTSSSPLPVQRYKWGLLLPVCCREKEGENCFHRLEELLASIDQTVDLEDRCDLCIILGIDQYDPFYDTPETKDRIKALFSTIAIKDVRIEILRSHYRGKLCRIWDYLADKAVRDNCCTFFVLIGDDVRFCSSNWKKEIELKFIGLSSARNLPFGVGCIAFRDESFNVFPTFPVMHRIHLQIFGTLFPIEFINQHGDPFLFELYRRFGANGFAPTATLRYLYSYMRRC